MIVLNYHKFLFLCVLSAIVCVGKCSENISENIDYKKALDIFVNAPEFNMRSLSDQLEFVSFMKNHTKVYSSQNELFDRLSIFRTNVDKADILDMSDRGTAQYGITQFSDHSEEELKNYAGLKFDPHKLLNTLGAKLYDDEFNRAKYDTLDKHHRAPRKFDWRKRGVITPVKNQGRCGSCWAFSAVGAVESHHAIKTGQLVALSEQQLVDCDTEQNAGCSGGYMHDAFQYIMNVGGLERSADYPYVGETDPNHVTHCDVKKTNQNSLVKVVSYLNVTQGEEDMKHYLYRHGPLSIAINAYSLYFYRRGIIDMSEYLCSPNKINHGVLLVGYGEETIDGQTIPYWIIKNSWDSVWGEKGYFRVKRGKNICGVAVLVSGVETDRKNEY